MPFGTVGIWATSSPAKKADFQSGISSLKKMGLSFYIPKTTQNSYFKKSNPNQPYLAGSDVLKIKAFEDLLKQQEIHDILAVRGGYGSLRLLPHLDQVVIPKSRKLRIWGFSDLTVLQNYFFKRCHFSWVHSPMLTSKTFFQPTPRDLLLQNQSCISLKILHKTSHFVGGKKLLLGGNLASYCTLLGTPWEPTPPPHWLFLEEIKEQPYKLDRLLTQLALSRSFKSCRGVVLGHFTECPQFKKIVKQWAVDHSTTVLFGFPAGHDRPNIPLILGDYVTLAPEKRGRVSFSRQIPILGA